LIRSTLAAGGLAVCLSACGGGSGATAPPSSEPTPSVTSAGGTGLIADVDRATVVAVCTNLKQAQEIVGTGIATDQVRAAIVAAIGQLSKPPHPIAALQLAATLRTDVRRHRLSAAVNDGLRWCTQQGA
jgi:hypothetical protein